MKHLKFKYFLLNENTEYLASRIGDILNALQDIQQHVQGMGTRQLVSNAERIVNQIRRILHTSWSSSDLDTVKMLQRVAVAIKKGIEEKSDLVEILGNSVNEIQDNLAKLGMPINTVGGEQSSKEDEGNDQTSPTQNKRQQPEIQTSQTQSDTGINNPTGGMPETGAAPGPVGGGSPAGVGISGS